MAKKTRTRQVPPAIANAKGQAPIVGTDFSGRPDVQHEALYLTEAQLRARWGNAFAAITFRHWRQQGKGPPWAKFGHFVLYPIDGIEAFEKSAEGAGVQDARARAASKGT